MQAPNTEDLGTPFVLFAMRRYFDGVSLVWYPTALQQARRCEGRVSKGKLLTAGYGGSLFFSLHCNH